MNDLWCLHLPGPDECHAAPSKAEAERVVAIFNPIMLRSMEAMRAIRPELSPYAPPVEATLAQVTPWPWSAEEHAVDLAQWKPADWGADEPAPDDRTADMFGKEQEQ